MNQKFIYSLEKEVNGRLYRLYMEVGASWAEAIDIVEEMNSKVKELAELASKQQQESQQSKEEPAEFSPELTES
jgi:hypothetical protein